MNGEIVLNPNDKNQVTTAGEAEGTSYLSEAEIDFLQQCAAITKADHEAIERSMGRDINGWLDRINSPKAS